MTQTEALQLALEALEKMLFLAEHEGWEGFDKQYEAITAIKEALAQPDQEPVAWIEHHKAGDNLVWDAPNKGTPLYITPERNPLTDEEIRKVNQDVWGYVSKDHTRMWQYARAIEAAHGIKE